MTARWNWERHRVISEEAEDVFFNEPLIVRGDMRDKRYYVLGQTGAGRYLFAVFTVRRSLLRVISVREMIEKKATHMPTSRRKAVPEFRSEDEERDFWASHDSKEFVDWRGAERRKLPGLKPTLRTISLRLPVWMIEDLKILANKRDVPYQSLLKVFLAERLKKELRRAS